MKNWLLKYGRALLLGGGTVLFLAGCETEGPAEKAGERIDQGVENAKEAVEPSPSAEKVGEKIDEAAKEIGDKVDAAAEKVYGMVQ